MIIREAIERLGTDILYPDMFISEAKKKKKEYIKTTLDYFYGQALRQFKENNEKIGFNYRFLKGELRPADFYEADHEVQDILNGLTDNNLPDYVQQYSIINSPINALCGEYAQISNDAFVKAFDAESQSEELKGLTELLTNYITDKVQQSIIQEALMSGADLQDPNQAELLQRELDKELEENLAGFTTQAEKWGNRVLQALKREFNAKEGAVESFYDLMVAGKNRWHVRESKSKTGFIAEPVNPKNTWGSKSPNKKYTRDWYSAGLIEVMEISEILEKFDLTIEEIEALKEEATSLYQYNQHQSNLFRNRTGINSIDYNLQNPMAFEEQMLFESKLMDEGYDDSIFENIESSGLLGQRHIVLTAYWLDKLKVGELTYIDTDGLEQTVLVDETYKSGSHPGELSLTWGYVNQWKKGHRIGNCIYNIEKLRILEYCPIIGIDFNPKNSKVASMVDLMKPYQMIFNLCMNQLWELLQKEKGVIHEVNISEVPVGKEESYEDALNRFMSTAKELGYVFKEDDPNKIISVGKTSVSGRLDLTRGQEMQTRIAICDYIKRECNSLIGITPERLGGISASQTLGNTQASLASSYSQTQPWFFAQQNVMNQVYQAIIDAAQYFESRKELSTISYLTTLGEKAFLEISGSDISMRDLRCFITSDVEDKAKIEELKQLSQAALQNGADFLAMAEVRRSDSMKEIMDILRKDKQNRDEMIAQQRQQEQAALEQQQAQFEATLQQQAQDKEIQRLHDSREKQLDRISRETVAALNASGRDSSILNDLDNSGVADALEVTKMQNQIDQANQAYDLNMGKIASQSMQIQQKMINEREKNKNNYDIQKEQLRIKEKEIEQKAKDSENKLKIAKQNKNKFDR